MSPADTVAWDRDAGCLAISLKDVCPGSGKNAIHSDASYAWMCPVCLFRPKVSSARDSTVMRPHAFRVGRRR